MSARELLVVQAGVAAAVTVLLWLLEARPPAGAARAHRWRHGGRNLALGGINAAVLALCCAGATATVSAWAEQARLGLLHRVAAPAWVEVALALLLLDGWMYAWHRASHGAPFLWRFHRAHHSDAEMDVTTAQRFHFGEILLSSTLRLAVIPLLGLTLWQVVLYETLLLPFIAFHHSSVAIPERLDRVLRAVIVSPGMHRVHHSPRQRETDSNYSSIFSGWDRLFGTFRRREEADIPAFGLRELAGEEWQSVPGILRTPLAPAAGPEGAEQGAEQGAARERRAPLPGRGGRLAAGPPLTRPRR